MHEPPVEPIKSPPSSTLAPNAIGPAIGTIMVLIAHGLPDTSAIKDPLLYAAPAVSVLLVALGIRVQNVYKNWTRNREENRAFRNGTRYISEAMARPDISLSRRSKLTTALEAFEDAFINKEFNKIGGENRLSRQDMAAPLDRAPNSDRLPPPVDKSMGQDTPPVVD